jgi:hypothetical protein
MNVVSVNQWIVLGLAILTAVSNLLAWMNRQQMAATKLEFQVQLAAMELRLSEKISGAYTSWQAHRDLEARVDRIEENFTVRVRVDGR